MQSKLTPDGHHAMKINEQISHDEEGHVQGKITVDKVKVNREDMEELKKLNPNAPIFDHRKKNDMKTLDHLLDEVLTPVSTGTGAGLNLALPPVQSIDEHSIGDLNHQLNIEQPELVKSEDN